MADDEIDLLKPHILSCKTKGTKSYLYSGQMPLIMCATDLRYYLPDENMPDLQA
jgi:hypothetical protein